jgi:predicted secreted hydrolase
MRVSALVAIGLALAMWRLEGPAGAFGQMPTRAGSAFEASLSDPWKRAMPGYLFSFPADHASHPPYKIEWWYYTGNLAASDGRRFGYQLTFFRVGVVFEPATPSRWAIRDLYMAHVAATDIEASEFYYADRVNRSASWYAGAETDRYRVWNEDWTAWLDESGNHRLRASDGGLALDLRLAPAKPPVIHGDHGISQKGARPGNATHYYSVTRLSTEGTLTMAGRPVNVRGTSWMDHEFGTSFLEPDQIGWDWFSMQLDDNSELMLFQLRRRDGSRDSHSSGTWVPGTGSPKSIGVADFTLNDGRDWKSPTSGAHYPVEWTVEIPSEQVTLQVKAAVDDQELDLRRSIGIAYWEGSILVEGRRRGRPVRGHGYLELTGYAGTGMGAVLQ